MQAPESTLTARRPGAPADGEGNQESLAGGRGGRIALAFSEPHRAAAVATTTVLLLVYWRTLLPGVSFQDWAEGQFLPATLGVHHSTGYPLYTLVGWLWSLLPIETLAYRANFLSALCVSLAMGVLVLILGRLGVRPVAAVVAAIATGLVGTVWIESAVAEMNGLHLLLVALGFHRLLVWGERFRPRDLWLLGLICGLALSNHRLAIVVVPILAAAAVWMGRRHPRALVAGAVGGSFLFVVGLAPYLFIPVRAAFGPEAIYAPLTTWDGFWYLVGGGQHASGFSFFSTESFRRVAASGPRLTELFLERSNVVVLAAALAGGIVLARRRPTALVVALGIGAASLFVYVNYAGAREQYLLATWLALGILVGLAVEAGLALIGRFEGRIRRDAGMSPGRWRMVVGVAAAFLLPLSLLIGNWNFADQRANRDGDAFIQAVMERLPPDAVIITYWDALTTLGYATCVGGIRPDVSAVSDDPLVRVTCRSPTGTWPEIAATRPLFALTPSRGLLDSLRADFELRQVADLTVPSDRRYVAHLPLYELIPLETE